MTEISSDAETSFQQALEAFNSSNLDLAIDLFNDNSFIESRSCRCL